MAEILCVGLAAYDLSLPLPYYPEENSKVKISTSQEAGGGPAANAAYLLSKWGVNTAFAGMIGDDLYGRVIVEEFKKVGTDISLLQICSKIRTSFSIILVNQTTGSRTIINRREDGPPYQPDLKILAKPNPKVLLFDGHEPEASLSAMKMYPEARTILDAGTLRPGTETLAARVDYLVASEKFALSWTGVPDLKSPEHRQECLRRLAGLCRGHVTVTLGEDGLIHNEGEAFHYLPAFPVEAIDTTGAGDIFHGVFAYGILKEYSLEETLRMASMAAALSVTISGGRQSIPDLSMVQEKKGEIQG
jgi:sugar/nucleoside kinase (ribokinase family)